MSTYTKPLPEPTALSQPFWKGAQEGKILVQKCASCGATQHPPRPLCGQCWSERLAWIACSHRGTVFSYAVYYRPTIAEFRDDAPYVVAVVEMPEGVRLTTNIVDCPMDKIAVDLPVQAVFDKATDEITLIKFKPT
ncbi:MAG TPA: Zn-ribbon domain-containing OB-fold protein [Bryobacteraceae bacterium]|jgi:hypothetical protein|nr:Zn-ribbon domain-containing OB-fold protein [Bryobacteraceae bacterium]